MLKLEFTVVAVIGLLSLVALGGLVGSVPVASETSDTGNKETETRPLVAVDVDGIKCTAPVFEDVTMTDARRALDLKVLGKFLPVIRKIFKQILVLKSYRLTVVATACGILPNILTSVRELKKLEKTDTSPKVSPSYGPKMGDFMFNIVATKSNEPIEKPKIIQRVNRTLECVEKLTETSPAGLYLDWAKARVEGYTMVDYMAPILSWLRKNGYNQLLDIFKNLASALKSLSY